MMEILFGFLGVLVGSAIPWVKEEWHRRRSLNENGRILAVRLTSMLDEYAQKCVAVVYDDGTSEGSPAGRGEQGEEYYLPQIETPEPPKFPDDADWHSIPFGLTYRIMALSNAAIETDRFIGHSADVACYPDYDELFSARQEGYAHLGLEALNLVVILRKEFGFPDLPKKFWDWGWDARKFLQEKLTEFQKRRQISETANAAMIAEMESVRGPANE